MQEPIPAEERIRKLEEEVSVLKDRNRELAGQVDRHTHDHDLLRALIDHIPDHIYIKDYYSQFLAVNISWCKWLNLNDPGEAVGKTDFDFFPHEFASQTYEEEKQIIAEDRPLSGKIEEFMTENGPQWLLVTKVPFKDRQGNCIGTCGISRNITDLKNAENALAHERNLLRTLIDHIPDYIFVKDTASRFVLNNQAHLTVLKAGSQEEVTGRTDFDVFPRELASQYYKDEQLIISHREPIIGREEPALDHRGNRQWLLTTKVPLVDTSGEVTGLVGISRDITDLKALNDALQKSRRELESRVEESTRDLRRRIDQLSFLHTTSYELAQFVRLEELGPAVIHAFTARFSRAEAIICLRTEEGFEFMAASEALQECVGSDAAVNALEAFRDNALQRPYLVENWREDEDVRVFPWPVSLIELPVYMVVPLLADNRSLGIVQLFVPEELVTRYPEEEQVITTLAAHTAACISNAQHYQEVAHQARVQSELETARTIQQQFLPSQHPAIPGIDLRGVYYPAFEVGGDYLDYFQNTRGEWVVVVADVCGKGIPAALFMTMVRTAFRSEARHISSAQELLCAVNLALRGNLDDKSFVTALCVIIDAKGRTLSYARAGHPQMIKISGTDRKVTKVQSEGLALGLVADQDLFRSVIEEKRLALSPGDCFLVCTDGLIEVLDTNQKTYGMERLCAMLAHTEERDPDRLISTVISDVRAYSDRDTFHDDLTICAFTVRSNHGDKTEPADVSSSGV